MDSPGDIYIFQMLLLLLLLGVCTIWPARLVQWLMLRKTHPRKNIFFILLISTVISYLLALIFWFVWPQTIILMWGIFFIPSVFAEIIILTISFIFLKRRNQL